MTDLEKSTYREQTMIDALNRDEYTTLEVQKHFESLYSPKPAVFCKSEYIQTGIDGPKKYLWLYDAVKRPWKVTSLIA